MGTNIKNRIILDIFIIFSIITLPWWFSAILILFGIFVFKFFYEFILFGLLADSLYSVPREFFTSFQFISLLLFLFLFVPLDWLKERLRI
ncbi:hypothetical protein A2442_01200 [Candidatus Campbellbacteria bacterium RIFOXYC2_FULL_35_25]|uniref:Uncharacterized protein n=1 Tax=Candidatus Campbellbacteria bacterium RIFOXYC2_FULL_35_25 TaxID=1797582 RepID=A0A1F5EH54_9BACT|nr:MAG: hypothetical protein A2442_01200 [Candidatus Campbellbacteria bacterium RIFOXYC2_FULL_35_25]